MKFGILVFPGSNCDRDCHHVLTRELGESADFVWHRETSVDEFDAIVIPGGFSYGDYLRAGAVARISPVMEAVHSFADRGGPVIGICNGFQILLECGMLPGAMLRNDTLRFICKPVHMRVATRRTPFTRRFEVDDVVSFPIANAEGNYFIDDDGYERLRDEDRIVFEYCDESGAVTPESNPNGSVFNIAGICNGGGNVVGLMPHPERAAERVLGGTDGLEVFRGAVELAAGGGR
jgi:phosphoribosylformylglycinamidine synthase